MSRVMYRGRNASFWLAVKQARRKEGGRVWREEAITISQDWRQLTYSAVQTLLLYLMPVNMNIVYITSPKYVCRCF